MYNVSLRSFGRSGYCDPKWRCRPRRRRRRRRRHSFVPRQNLRTAIGIDLLFFKGDPPSKNLSSKPNYPETFYLFQKQGTQVGFIFFQKKFQNRTFFGIYGPKRADVSTFSRYTLRKNRLTYDLEILTQAKYHKYGGIYKRKF